MDPCPIRLSGFNQNTSSPKGQCEVTVNIAENLWISSTFVVVDELSVSMIIGYPFMRYNNISMDENGDFKVKIDGSKRKIKNLTQKPGPINQVFLSQSVKLEPDEVIHTKAYIKK